MSVAHTAGAALLAGLAGGAHCLAMCGGIAGALGLSSRAAARAQGREPVYPLMYSAGRITSYALAGALFGAFGQGVLAGLGGERLRLPLQLLAGALLVVVGVRMAWRGRAFALLDGLGTAAWRRIAPLTRHVLPVRSLPRAFAAGMIWGWLPCGMAWGMLIVAGLSASAGEAALTMAAFGIGTLPAVLVAGSGVAALGALRASPAWRTAGGVLIAGLGALAVLAPFLATDAAHGGHGLLGVLDCLPGLAPD